MADTPSVNPMPKRKEQEPEPMLSDDRALQERLNNLKRA